MNQKMMNNFDLENGAIWEVAYYAKEIIPIDPQVEQSMIDQHSRDILQDSFSPPPGLSPGEYSQLFMQHFMKTRQKSRELIEDNVKVYRYSLLCQLGNNECLEDLENIEKSQEFHRWENPGMIDYFREISKQYI